MDIFIGDYVKTKRHNHVGRVYKKHYCFWEASEDENWFKIQKLPESAKSESWVSVLCKDGGSILTPVSDCQLIEKIELNNVWEYFHFRKE